MKNLMGLSATLQLDADIVKSDTSAGEDMRHWAREYCQANDGHSKSISVEMRYPYGPFIRVPSELDRDGSPLGRARGSSIHADTSLRRTRAVVSWHGNEVRDADTALDKISQA
ncbi:FAD-dependent monooxygenase [Aspergillus udagawae]|uniref:FAD-dependent monooxygenase n=1 Tax=Aspergillus udagawae TaxID=91492 RepID=A0ABQ1B5C0_9EURO|nr:FAD-dependent monooxygenase [Aspergillus udagawae]GFF94044.1 FAD-dependent monooxygenase [Aspergillus udagawae]GFG16047.1 FAD-dependent monooxygenase [Aspergillus udagawae]